MDKPFACIQIEGFIQIVPFGSFVGVVGHGVLEAANINENTTTILIIMTFYIHIFMSNYLLQLRLCNRPLKRMRETIRPGIFFQDENE